MCSHQRACKYGDKIWWCHECGAIAKHEGGGRPSKGQWEDPQRELERLTIKQLKFEVDRLKDEVDRLRAVEESGEGKTLEAVFEECKSDESELKVQLEPKRWWPQSVECNLCHEQIKLSDEEPDCYMVKCDCGGFAIIKP